MEAYCSLFVSLCLSLSLSISLSLSVFFIYIYIYIKTTQGDSFKTMQTLISYYGDYLLYCFETVPLGCFYIYIYIYVKYVCIYLGAS